MTRPPNPLWVAFLTTLAVALLAWTLPPKYASPGVALCFCAATYLGVLRHDTDHIRRYGLSLGGLAEPEPLSFSRLARSAGRALVLTLLLSLGVFPLYWLGYRWWFEPDTLFQLKLAASPLDEVLGHWLAVGLPEEMFYRGYLQSALDERWPPKLKVLGANVGLGLLLSSAIFALGHLATEPQLGRLAVFFPSLLFGWLKARVGGVGTPALFHASCNIFSVHLARGYGFIPVS